MDVRCEKCQTEYELDEARLKPGGVTVKCTHCGHMFKIRKRSTTNVGTTPGNDRARTPSAKPAGPAHRRADSMLDEETAVRPSEAEPPEERQWLLRLENGEQRSCRELASLQQWIVAGVVTRESLISRSGKTWKRLGDITELAQYFTVADEAKATREHKPTGKQQKPAAPGTLLGLGVTAAGGTILPDDDDLRTTGNYRARPKTSPPSPPPKARPQGPSTPPLGSNANAPEPAPAAARRPPTQPPPPPRKAPSVPASNRSTGAWVSGSLGEAETDAESAGPHGGRVKASTSEPAFAGTVRVVPGDEAGFVTSRINSVDEDEDDMLPARRGSRAGLLLLFLAVLIMGGAAGAIYVFVIKKDRTAVATAPADAAVEVAADAPAPVITAVIDAAEVAPPSPVDAARAELAADVEDRLRAALTLLDGQDTPGASVTSVHLAAAIAQGLLDRAAISADKREATQLKNDAKQLVLDVASAAQRAHKAAPTDVATNLAMAHVLRLQGKSTRDIQRYLDAAKAAAAPEWATDLGLAEALALIRDGKLAEAKTALDALDQGDAALETSGDVRLRFQRARVAFAMNQPADATPLIEQLLAAQPEHAGAKALAARLETMVAKTDPLPPEDPTSGGTSNSGGNSGGNNGTTNTGGGGDTYDRLLARANTAAERSCTQAIALYAQALEQKPNGVEALTGMGYCHIDAKQFASAFSKFRAALAVSSRYEPALWGVGEAYQQQGRKEQAIEAFRKYLDTYPNSAKALKALDRLGANAGSGATPPAPDAGASGDPGGEPSGGGSAEPTPTPTPTPTPAPAPAPTPAPADE